MNTPEPTSLPHNLLIHITDEIHTNLLSLVREIKDRHGEDAEIASTDQIKANAALEEYLGALCMNVDASFPCNWRHVGLHGFVIKSDDVFNLPLEGGSKVVVVIP